MSASLNEILQSEREVMKCLDACYQGGGIHYVYFSPAFDVTTARIEAIEWVIKQGKEQ